MMEHYEMFGPNCRMGFLGVQWPHSCSKRWDVQIWMNILVQGPWFGNNMVGFVDIEVPDLKINLTLHPTLISILF